jgi:hypothetical protein
LKGTKGAAPGIHIGDIQPIPMFGRKCHNSGVVDGILMKKTRKAGKKKPSFNETVDKLTAIAEEHLAKLPEEERARRVAAFSRMVVTPSHHVCELE